MDSDVNTISISLSTLTILLPFTLLALPPLTEDIFAIFKRVLLWRSNSSVHSSPSPNTKTKKSSNSAKKQAAPLSLGRSNSAIQLPLTMDNLLGEEGTDLSMDEVYDYLDQIQQFGYYAGDANKMRSVLYELNKRKMVRKESISFVCLYSTEKLYQPIFLQKNCINQFLLSSCFN